MTAAVLDVRALGHSYGPRRVLDEVTFALAPGEVVAILGPSGAGKTTLFRSVTRLVEPEDGQILLGARDLHGLRGRALQRARRDMGLIFQQFNLVRRLSALDNVLLGRVGYVSTLDVVLRRFRDQDRALAHDCLDRVGLGGHAGARADRLSGGQQQRVAIARVLAQQSTVILADEPVASLDPHSANLVLDTLRSVAAERGIAVLCTLHQVDLATGFADRILGLRHGRLILDRPAAAFDDSSYRLLYGDARSAR